MRLIANRNSKVKCKYLKSHNLKQDPKHFTYLHLKKLVIVSKFPKTCKFKWIDRKSFDLKSNCSSNSLKSCF